MVQIIGISFGAVRLSVQLNVVGTLCGLVAAGKTQNKRFQEELFIPSWHWRLAEHVSDGDAFNRRISIKLLPQKSNDEEYWIAAVSDCLHFVIHQ